MTRRGRLKNPKYCILRQTERVYFFGFIYFYIILSYFTINIHIFKERNRKSTQYLRIAEKFEKVHFFVFVMSF